MLDPRLWINAGNGTELRLHVLFYLRKGLMDKHGVYSCYKSVMFVKLVCVDNVIMLLENCDLFLRFISWFFIDNIIQI